MRGRIRNCSSPPPPGPDAGAPTLADAPLPEPTGPGDDRFVYSLSPMALQYLREREAAEAVTAEEEEAGDGRRPRLPLARPVARAADVGDAIAAESKRRRRRDARRRGRRLVTVSYVTRGSRRVPLLRLSGHWLRDAGFDLGQELEVEVDRGRLTLEAIIP